jgi:hypothetical protein
MVTKEQALAGKQFVLTHIPQSNYIGICDAMPSTPIVACTRLYYYRSNGKCKTWKRDATRFRLPVKHGLYSYSYITESNAHMFEIVS